MLNLSQQVKKTGLAAMLALSALSLAACVPETATREVKVSVWPAPPEEPRYFFERGLRGSFDVIQESAADRFRRIATGESISGRGLGKPYGVAAFDGRVFVGDTVERKVAVFDLIGNAYYEIGTEGLGALAKPLGLAVDGKNRLYVVDGSGKRIVIYDATDGRYISAIGGGDALKRPTGIAVNREGTRIYVIDTGGVDAAENHRVLIFNEAGEKVGDFGGRGSEPGKFNLPLNATVAPDGRLYVVDAGNFRIQVFSPDGKFEKSIGSVGRRMGQFSRPKGVAVDKEGKVYVVDSAFGNFQIFDKEGALLLFVGDRGDDGGPGQFLLPAGVAVDETGRVYVVDQFFSKVDVFRPAGVPEKRAPRPGAAPAKGKSS